MDPYALGLLLGDGCLTGATTPSFSTEDPELGRGPRSRRCREWRSRYKDGVRLRAQPGSGTRRGHHAGEPGHGSHATPRPHRHAIAHEVHPARATCSTPLKCGSPLLQGLLDTDGGPVTQADRTCRVQYATTSPRLRDDVRRAGPFAGGCRVRAHSTCRGPRARARERTRRGLPPRRVRHRPASPCRCGAVPTGPQAGEVRVRRRRRSADALHRQHRARRPCRDRVHPGCGGRLAVCHRGPPAHAQHPQRRVHHSRRGAEHHSGTDEDVPHPPRIRQQDRRDR